MRFASYDTPYVKYKFYDVVSITNGQVDPNLKEYCNLPHIGPGNIEKGTGILLEFNLAKDDSLISSKYLFTDDCVIYGKINPHFAKACYPNFTGLCSADAYPLKVNNLIKPYYLLQLILSKRFTKFTTSISKRTGMPKVNRNDLSSYNFYLPSLEEQTKIIALIEKIDNRILAQKKIINKLKSLIISIKNTEFYNIKGFKEKLENILIELNEKTIINNQYEVLSSTLKGIFKQSDYFDRAVASENNIGYKIVKKGNIVVSPQNLWMGNISYNDKFDIGIVSPSYKIFKISCEYNERYIFEMLTTKKSLYLFKTVSEQGASVVRRNLNYEAFMQLAFHIPPLNGQNYFIEKLSLLQSKLSLENKILSLLEQQKQYLLDKLFI